VEDVAMAELLEIARSCGLRMVVGRYFPTPRNELVRGLFPELGFTLEEKTEDQKCTYRLDLAGTLAKATQITVQRHS